MPTKKTAKTKKRTPPKSELAQSTRHEGPNGSHVITVVKTSSATAEEPVVVQSVPTTPEEWLAVGRQCWNSNADCKEHHVILEYSSYKTKFSCRGPHGCVRWSDIDAEYALSFVFEGDYKVSIRRYPEGTNSSSDEELTPFVPMAVGKEGKNEDNTRDRSVDEIYFFIGAFEKALEDRFVIVIDEELADLGAKQGGIKFVSSAEGVSWRGDGGGRKKEGCSCLYGNPCIDQYVCNDWANRFEVAKRNS